jgi:hypothetical protein
MLVRQLGKEVDEGRRRMYCYPGGCQPGLQRRRQTRDRRIDPGTEARSRFAVVMDAQPHEREGAEERLSTA